MKGSFFIKIGTIFLLSSAAVFAYKNADKLLTDFNNDYLLSRIVVENIENTYTTFNNDITKYKEDMETFYGSLDFYYDNFIRKNRAMVTYLKEVEKDLKALEGPSLRMYDNCKYEINDDETLKMCENYKENLKGVMDSYNKLVVDYNDVLDSFNAFAESNNRANDVVPPYESQMSDKLIRIYEEIKK